MMELVVLSISFLLLVPYALLILYYRQSWVNIPVVPFSPAEPLSLKISIIIPARNEEANIETCLNSILAQSYPRDLFDVLVVDDHSTDNTPAIIKSYQHRNVSLITLKDFLSAGEINAYKKKAIEIAVGQASGELIVTTDADCIVPTGWLHSIATCYQKNNAAFIAMPVSYNYKKNFLEVFQALDFMTLQGITGAAVSRKIHSMCNGANLAYEKKAFIEVGGFKGIDQIASGDDMLLMHKIYKRYPNRVLFLKSPDVIVLTQPMDTVKAFFNQRIRWASKADHYEDKRIFAVLLLVYFLNVWILFLAVAALFYPLWHILVGILAAKTIIELLFLYPVARFFNQSRLLWWFPLAQPFHIVYTIIAGWLGKFGTYQWKERKVT